jgi:hypothetical protein
MFGSLNQVIAQDDADQIDAMIAMGMKVTDSPFPLLLAARYNATKVLRLLLDKGVDVNIKDDLGSTALHKAARYNSLQAVRMLLEAGADPEKLDSDGHPPSFDAEYRGHDDVLVLLRSHPDGGPKTAPQEPSGSEQKDLCRWQTARVFISSTFHDMEAERDHLVTVVFPKLRERLREDRINVVDIDLRWGITQEQSERDEALEICLDTIDESDFFICLLGERYGWVPMEIPRCVTERFPHLSDGNGISSITAMEITHHLSDPERSGTALYAFRSPAAVETISNPETRERFIEADSGKRERLLELKDRIRGSGAPVLDGYPAQWDDEAASPSTGARGRFTELDGFGDWLAEEIERAIRGTLHPSKRGSDRETLALWRGV